MIYNVLSEFYDMTDKRVVLTTAGSQDEARRIALALTERNLAACVNIVGPIESIYQWQGKVEQAAEWLLIIKTSATAFDRVRDTIREIHSYELPECIELDITDGSSEYLDWIAANVRT